MKNDRLVTNARGLKCSFLKDFHWNKIHHLQRAHWLILIEMILCKYAEIKKCGKKFQERAKITLFALVGIPSPSTIRIAVKVTYGSLVGYSD